MIEGFKPGSTNIRRTMRDEAVHSYRALFRRLTLLTFAIAGILLIFQAIVFSYLKSGIIYWYLECFLLVLAVVMAFGLSGKDLGRIYLNLSTGSSFIMVTSILTIFLFESLEHRWVEVLGFVTIALFISAIAISMMTAKAPQTMLIKLEPAWFGLLSVGFIYIFSFMIQYVLIVLDGTDFMLTDGRSRAFYEFPWVMRLTIIYCCLYTITTVVYLAHAWRVRQKDPTRHAVKLGQSLGFNGHVNE
jgi:hypothetical protein